MFVYFLIANPPPPFNTATVHHCASLLQKSPIYSLPPKRHVTTHVIRTIKVEYLASQNNFCRDFSPRMPLNKSEPPAAPERENQPSTAATA